MADDQNKSNRPPMNGFGMSEIDKIGQSAYSIPKSEQEQRIRATTARTQMNALQDLPDDVILGSRALTRVAQNAPNTLMNAEQRIRSSVNSRLERSNAQAVNAIGREYSDSAINGQVRGLYDSPVYQNQALTMMNMPYEQMSQRRQAISGQINALGASSADAASGLFTSRGPRRDLANQISGNAQSANSMVQELAGIDLALKTRRQSGSDPLSKFERLNSIGKSAEDYISARSIGQEINSGGVNINRGGKSERIDNGNIGMALAQEADNLKKALSDLANSAGKSAEDLDKMRRVAEESAENFDKLSKASGGAGSGRNNTIGYLNATAGGFNAVGGGAQQIMINQRMQEMSNISGFAGMANTQYDMYKKARGGDIASQLALGQFGAADDFGAEMKNATNVVQGANAIGAGAQTGAGILQATTTINPLENALSTSAAQANRQAGILNSVQGGVNLAVIGSDVQRGTSAQGNRLAGVQAQLAARQAINAVGSQQAQGLRDFYTGLDVVGQNMGGKASSFIQNSTSDSNMQRMQDARMSPEQYLQSAKFGAENIGSTFKDDQIFAARNLESRGYGSAIQNMGRQAQLSGAGANNPKEALEGVLSAAVTAGLQGSPAINAMVANTAVMAASSSGAAVGIDTTAATSSMLGAGINPGMANKEFAIQQAMSAAELTKTQTTNKDVSYYGMVNTAGLQDALGKKGININGDQAINLQGVDVNTLKSLQNDPKRAAEFFKDKGINIQEGNANTAVGAVLREKQLQIIRSATTTQGLNAGDILDKMNAGTLSDKEKAQVASGAVLGGRTGFGELEREVKGVTVANAVPGAGEDLTGKPGPDDLKKQMDLLRTSGFKQLTEAAATASTQLGGFAKAVKTFNDLQTKFEKDGRANENEFTGAASKMAKEFTVSVGRFDTATTKYEEASAAMMVAAGLFSNRNPVKPAFMDNKNQTAGSTKGKH